MTTTAAEGSMPDRPWWEVLGVEPHKFSNVVDDKYMQLARQHHPDRGGDPKRMAEINNAYDAFKKERNLA